MKNKDSSSESTRTTSAVTPLLEVRGISKSYEHVTALSDVSLELYQNEILGLVGENGSGKSTLVKILTGIVKPDSGEIYVRGTKVVAKNPKEAERFGVSVVHQDSGIVPALKVYEWLSLGKEPTFYGILKRSAMRQTARQILDELNIKCDPDTVLQDLDPVTQKLIEIAKAFLNVRKLENAPVIILDEASAPLSDPQRNDLYERLQEFKKKGSFIFVSHLIPEVLKIADRIHILRASRNVKVFDLHHDHVVEQDIYGAMVGRELDLKAVAGKPTTNEIVLSVDKICRQGAYSDISFDLYRGEILGMYGTVGSGKSEIGKTIAGLINHESGRILKNNEPLDNSVRERINNGIGYLSGNNREELFLYWSIARNISVSNLSKIVKRIFGLPLLDLRKEKEMATKIVQRLDVRPSDTNQICNNLSGGNRQKIALGRWVERKLDILIMENPTIGVDAGAREEFYKVLSVLKEEGHSFLLVSDERTEVDRLSDRILLVQDGKISKFIARSE